LVIGFSQNVPAECFLQLQAFLDECRQLGRSYDLILTARALREWLGLFLILFYRNARQLSPIVLEPDHLHENTMYRETEHKDSESLPVCLENVAAKFETLREHLHEFDEHTVRALSSSFCRSVVFHQAESIHIKSLMQSFAKHLKVRPCTSDLSTL
jgi:hypothetical protein